ncbi:hypothetical protein PHET_00642 [Paragonimus heterotremus]|uniref:Laminin G domain-containing protein n=1 Tax=Paragonimus heterotremus TaxID=100268 RepID=A0A8J4WKZ0_9TREM|nr:hypothetical protein PHET_00642 [Paragonimus heterotremus]
MNKTMRYKLSHVLHFIVLQLIAKCFKYCDGSVLLLRSPDSYASFPSFIPCPYDTLSFQFYTRNPKGLLAYAEDEATGRFMSITLLPQGRLKLEMELRLPQYRISRDHITVMLEYMESGVEKHDLWNHSNPLPWHTFNLTIHSGEISNMLSSVTIQLDRHQTVRQFTPGIIFLTHSGEGRTLTYFGHPLYIGQLPARMRTDATQRALFSSAMQPSFQGMIKNINLGSCALKTMSESLTDPIPGRCGEVPPQYLGNGAYYVQANQMTQHREHTFCSSSVTYKRDRSNTSRINSTTNSALYEQSSGRKICHVPLSSSSILSDSTTQLAESAAVVAWSNTVTLRSSQSYFMHYLGTSTRYPIMFLPDTRAFTILLISGD